MLEISFIGELKCERAWLTKIWKCKAIIWKSKKPPTVYRKPGNQISYERLRSMFFQTLINPVLLYGSETWTLTKQLERSLDDCYTRLLRAALNISWRDKVTNEDLHGDLLKVTRKVKERRLSAAGRFSRHQEEAAGTCAPGSKTWITRVTPQNLCAGFPWRYWTTEHLRSDFSNGGRNLWKSIAVYWPDGGGRSRSKW